MHRALACMQWSWESLSERSKRQGQRGKRMWRGLHREMHLVSEKYSLQKHVTCAGYLPVCVRLPPVQILLEKVINLGFPAGQQAGGNASVSHGPVCPTGVGNGQTLLIKCDGHCVPNSWGPLKALAVFPERNTRSQMKGSVKAALQFHVAAALWTWFSPGETPLPFSLCAPIRSSHQNMVLLFPLGFRQVVFHLEVLVMSSGREKLCVVLGFFFGGGNEQTECVYTSSRCLVVFCSFFDCSSFQLCARTSVSWHEGILDDGLCHFRAVGEHRPGSDLAAGLIYVLCWAESVSIWCELLPGLSRRDKEAVISYILALVQNPTLCEIHAGFLKMWCAHVHACSAVSSGGKNKAGI